MRFISVCESDIGISKKANQDSLIVKRGQYENGELLMAIICDGMGGLEKGEVASSSVVHAFDKWFDEQLPYELLNPDLNVIAYKWALMLKELNAKIMAYGEKERIQLGTTFTGVLFLNNMYLCVHVGDTRLYALGSDITQLSQDHTFVAREVSKGNMSPEQAEKDKRRNLLLQCIGASDTITPQVFVSELQQGMYLLCCDGFRHEISDREIYDALSFKKNKDEYHMLKNIKMLINMNKKRNEKDNISAILIRVEA